MLSKINNTVNKNLRYDMKLMQPYYLQLKHEGHEKQEVFKKGTAKDAKDA
jgi:hypothetical protein